MINGVKVIIDGFDAVLQGARAYPVWTFLAWFDTRQRYKRSIIGPFWLTISMAITIGCLGGLYSLLFNIDGSKFMPFVAIGLVLWTYISQTVRESCQSFIESGSLIKQVKIPVTAFVFRVLYRNVIFLLHHIPIIVVAVLWAGIPSAIAFLTAMLGLVLLTFSLFCIGVVLAFLSARFRDIPMIVENVMQLFFYVTPIVWIPSMLEGAYKIILKLNPLFYAIEIIRAPLISDVPSADVYLNFAVLAAIFALGGIIATARAAKALAYWV